MKQEEPILVAIHCLVYNHEPYLRDCFEGFVMQKTNFRFVVVVHDDVSKDGSAAIIREYEEKYPDIFRPIYETENQWSKPDGSLGRIMGAAIDATGAKYIAMCEGDDYWTDPYKLQKQVDFMEAHHDYVACFHNAFVDYGCGRSLFNSLTENHYPTTEDIIERRWFISTQTLMYRNIHLVYPEWTGSVKNGDYLLELLLAKEGKFYYMDDVMAVYRKQGQGFSVQLNAQKADMYDKLIYLLSNMKEYYAGTYADSFDRSIANYQKEKATCEVENYYATHPVARIFRPKTYKRIIKKWLKTKIN